MNKDFVTFHEQNYRFKKSDNKVNLFHFPSHFPVCHDHIVEFFMNSFINISVKTKGLARFLYPFTWDTTSHVLPEYPTLYDWIRKLLRFQKSTEVLLRSTVVATEGTEVLLRSTEVAPKRTEVLLRRIEGCFPSF